MCMHSQESDRVVVGFGKRAGHVVPALPLRRDFRCGAGLNGSIFFRLLNLLGSINGGTARPAPGRQARCNGGVDVFDSLDLRQRHDQILLRLGEGQGTREGRFQHTLGDDNLGFRSRAPRLVILLDVPAVHMPPCKAHIRSLCCILSVAVRVGHRVDCAERVALPRLPLQLHRNRDTRARARHIWREHKRLRQCEDAGQHIW
mmetsp:Transcript_53340/g.122583  ORF Transcript_53340/g.122583 Transcript_53340/m.122583 type:complete len:202 (+) Transcript_53340:548-1153(+)